MNAVLSIEKIKLEIEKICQKSQRPSAKVKILAVSKLQSLDKIKNLLSSGQIDFGENYVQEWSEKNKTLAEDKIHWHLIGHLQKNKVKMIVGKIFLIHSVDSLELAQEINKRSAGSGVRQKILLQVNVAGEASKEGFDPDHLQSQAKNIFALPHLEILGLMTMPPFVENPEDNRVYFRKLKDFLMRLQKENGHPANFTELSMGTSQDYQVAIEEGATWIRLGSTVFGPRS